MVTETYVNVDQSIRSFILTTLSAKVLAEISYTAVRGVDDEVGAVQRILTERRIKSLKEFTLNGGDFPGCIVLNWVKGDLAKSNNLINFNPTQRMAQIIDGQHRVAGIKAAMAENDEIGEIRIPVVIYENLTTKDCADIFLAINTEQKPAPRSLVFDLYGVSSDITLDPAASRARDIAAYLNEEQDSPFFGKIKFPGEKRRKGGIALSTAVAAIKPLVENNASFEQIGICELHLQIKSIINYFNAIRSEYGDQWDTSINAFQYAAGFTAACQFLMLKIIPYCNQKASFEAATIKNSIKIRENGLIKQEEVAGRGGAEGVRVIYTRLESAFSPTTDATGIKF